jgi:hypothetical protein
LRSFFEIDVLNVFDGTAEKALTEAAKFLNGVGGEELDSGCGAALFRVCGRGHKLLQMRGHSMGGRFG